MEKNLYIKILIAIIIMLAIVFFLKTSKTENKQNLNDYKENMSIKDIETIIEKSNNITSYRCKYLLPDGQEATEKYKNNKGIIEIENNFYYYDYENKKTILLGKEQRIAIKKNDLDRMGDTLKIQLEEISKVLKTIEKDEYSTKDNEIYDNKNCILIEIKKIYSSDGWSFDENLKEYDGKEIIYKIWMEKETGAVLKKETKCEDKKFVTEYKYEFNCVTDEEMIEPNLTGYKIIEQ